jgi:hypothetical protein
LNPLDRYVKFLPVPHSHGFLLTQALPGAPKSRLNEVSGLNCAA